mmetsp:Transcript_84540/g.147127  ORF Transcript_84540/g.147127 Transcript_84540/m.147127 type:complete len:184 (-) Transcript_84540:68-619(-)
MLTLGDLADIKSTGEQGRVSMTNGHAHKVCGKWYLAEELQKPSTAQGGHPISSEPVKPEQFAWEYHPKTSYKQLSLFSFLVDRDADVKERKGRKAVDGNHPNTWSAHPRVANRKSSHLASLLMRLTMLCHSSASKHARAVPRHMEKRPQWRVPKEEDSIRTRSFHKLVAYSSKVPHTEQVYGA